MEEIGQEEEKKMKGRCREDETEIEELGQEEEKKLKGR